ncbi:MAG: nicotinate phosphoribosyltransferase [Oscillospiraceae bacterium]|nr:nicotinate phosphoribosyltransferase [Oscillospiraceae bacterium]
MIDWKNDRNLTMLTDYYEMTMSHGYFRNGFKDKIVVFDMFFRKIPNNGGFAIFAGLEQLIEYMKNLHFTQEDIEYLRGRNMFCEEFLEYLANFKFECDVWAMKEGTPVFPMEPIVVVKGPIIQAQLVETMVLLTVNYQSLVATKARRIVNEAQGRMVMEFGSRRAQSYDAAILGARASYIGGCDATACVIADRDYKIPAVGTMAHSWVQLFDTEYEAFKTYAEIYPFDCTLLVDTYNVLKSGIPNAIKVFDEIVVPSGHRPKGVRIDSGDIAYLSKEARKLLDEAGYEDVKIIASNSLDEVAIRGLLMQKAKIDSFGVGENLITSKSDPVFGGVYKLVAVENADGSYTPKIKLSESAEKITNPHFKKVFRLYSNENGMAIADYVTIFDEEIDCTQPLTIFDPNETWKKKTISDFHAVQLLHPIFEKGECVYEVPALNDVRTYCAEQMNTIVEEIQRLEWPRKYYVDLSDKLYDIKKKLIYTQGQLHN